MHRSWHEISTQFCRTSSGFGYELCLMLFRSPLNPLRLTRNIWHRIHSSSRSFCLRFLRVFGRFMTQADFKGCFSDSTALLTAGVLYKLHVVTSLLCRQRMYGRCRVSSRCMHFGIVSAYYVHCPSVRPWHTNRICFKSTCLLFMLSCSCAL